MNHPFIYVGCFFEFCDLQNAIREIRTNALENDIQCPHVTFLYKPQEVNQTLFGKAVHVKITGYANNGENEAVKVQLSSSDPILESMISKIEIPHITIAVSREGKPVNSKNLQFEDIEPIDVTGTYGGYAKWGEVILHDKNSR